MRRLSWITLVAIVAAIFLPQLQPMAGSLQHDQSQQSMKACKTYNGKWWSLATPEEQDGFLNGSADCLVWVGHEEWVSHSVAWAIPKITAYYRTHKAKSADPVVDVWRRVLLKAPPDIKSPAAEEWKNPHGYFDGLYWREGSKSEHVAFLEGYLACLRTRVRSSSQVYSHPIDYYVDKIGKYVDDTKTHPHSDHEAIANILAQFQDRSKP